MEKITYGCTLRALRNRNANKTIVLLGRNYCFIVGYCR